MEPADLHSDRGNAGRGLRAALQRVKDLLAGKLMRNPVQHQGVGGLDADVEQLHARPSDLQGTDKKPDSVLPAGIRGADNAVNDQHMPRSVWANGMAQRLADYIRYVREVDQQPDQPDIAGESHKPNQRHICKRDPDRSCSCPSGVCADDDATYRYARGPFLVASTDPRIPVPKPNHLGNFRCPISGKLCSEFICRDWCSGG